MKTPANLAKNAVIEHIKKAAHGHAHARSKITNEYIVRFADVEERDAVKSYASGLASANGMAGLRLELTDVLRGSYKILDEHGLAVKQLYGNGTKRNIKFDDRVMHLMMDMKLPGSVKWHNITIEQACQSKKLRESSELARLISGKSVSGGEHDKEKAKVLMLVYTPERKCTNAIASGGQPHRYRIELSRKL